ncbi:MAG: Kynurenine formamidase [Methanocella sp. PtaU1.Bin125]|nr:MAG: Kynurenine formamidase [Methanocella sp. PtaU1.Bin125]
MKIYDISVDIYNGMPAFPGDPAPVIKRVLEMPRDPANVSVIDMGTHTGTHVDPPVHFIENGLTLDKIPLEHLYGDAEVLDLTHVKKAITAADLESATENILLLKTRNSAFWQSPEFRQDYVYLDKSAAQWLIDNHVWTVAIDYLSVGSFEGGEAVHKMLLKGGVTLVEGVNLSAVGPGRYRFACLPIKIRNGDGGPARAILIKE